MNKFRIKRKVSFHWFSLNTVYKDDMKKFNLKLKLDLVNQKKEEDFEKSINIQ